jgi:hypothetical protein
MPLKALHPRASKTAPWVLVDPNLRADCLAVYRILRMAAIASLVLLGSPFRSWAGAHRRSGVGELLVSEISSNGACAEVGVRTSSRYDSHRDNPPLAELHWNREAPAPQLVCLGGYRAHAPPRGEIPDDPKAQLLLSGSSSGVDISLLRSRVIFPSAVLNLSSSGLSNSPTRRHSGRESYVATQEIHFLAREGDNRHVCC